MTVVPLPQAQQLLAIGDERDRAAAVAQLRADLTEAVAGLATRGRARRPAVTGRPSPAALSTEAAALAAASATLRRLAAVFADAAAAADDHLADAVREHLGTSQKSARIPLADGQTAAVTITQPSVTRANPDTVEDVLAGWAASEHTEHPGTAARATRTAVRRLLALVSSSPGWKTTAASAVAAELVAAGEPALGERLAGAITSHKDADKPERVRVTLRASS